MLNYSELYELVRKEKFSDNLQLLPKNFLSEFAEYLDEKKKESMVEDSLFSDSGSKAKKQFENSFALFKELVLRRKKKILNLVFVAAETGIMKRDYENMLVFEREIFDSIVKVFEKGDKELSTLMNGRKDKIETNKMVIFLEDVEEFVDMNGLSKGPYTKGQLANLESGIVDLFISSGKARVVDEN